MVKQSLQPAHSVLVTRPEGQGQAFARKVKERFGTGVRVVISPLMAPLFLAPDLPRGDFAGVIFTSATGVAAAGRLWPDLPRRAFCVGRKTAEAARDAGFQAVSADGDAGDLLALILADPPEGALLHLRGAESAGDLAGRLTAAGVRTEALVIYRQEPQALGDEALTLLRASAPVILPIFSPRSAVLFAKALPTDARAGLFIAALSPAVAAATSIAHVRLVTAARPDADAMLDALADLIVAAPPP